MQEIFKLLDILTDETLEMLKITFQKLLAEILKKAKMVLLHRRGKKEREDHVIRVNLPSVHRKILWQVLK